MILPYHPLKGSMSRLIRRQSPLPRLLGMGLHGPMHHPKHPMEVASGVLRETEVRIIRLLRSIWGV